MSMSPTDQCEMHQNENKHIQKPSNWRGAKKKGDKNGLVAWQAKATAHWRAGSVAGVCWRMGFSIFSLLPL